MPSTTIVVEAHVVERGLWCDHCLLPSKVRIVFVPRLNPARRLGQTEACTDCGDA